jgi:hypothetical protein
MQRRGPPEAERATRKQEEDPMATAAPELSQAQFEAFAKKLRAFRDTLPEDDQRILDAMYHASMGTHEEKDDDMHAYWVAAGPRGVAVGGYGGVAVAPVGVAYRTYY